MSQVRTAARWLLGWRHVVYTAVLSAALIGALRAPGPWAVVAGVTFVAVAVVWSREFQTRSMRRGATDRERLQRVQRDVRGLGDRLDQHTAWQGRVVTAVEQGRLAAERAAWARAGEATPADAGRRPHVVFVTSNGSGMGHLTRLLAIARAGDGLFDSSYVSLSTAAQVVTEFGYPCVRVASQGHTGLSWPEWNRRFARFMRSHLESVRPDAVVFDGIQVFRGVHEAAQDMGIPLVWVARGLWKDGVPRDQIRSWRDVAELVLVPTERPLLPDEEALPVVGAGLEPVDPIVFLRPEERLGRGESIERLGLEPTKQHVLIQLGSGALASRAELEDAAVEAVRALGPEWEPVVFRSPLSREPAYAPAGARVLREYPMSAYLAAFDFSVTSAGYNTVHENIRYAQPAVYVPDRSMLADDQARRASSVARSGAGIVAESTADLSSAVRTLADSAHRDAVARRADEISTADGAGPAARSIARVITTTRLQAGLAYDVYEPVRIEST